ncbi:hypothetical protein V7124_14710 [Neobacillus niacini]|uniref:hypothetical protein n=1 Tax=Neobacillus niacini TaxID=86668 RepID=UPI002FFEC370
MSTKSNKLQYGWTLIAHPTFQIFTNKNAYVIIDEGNDVMIRFTLQETEIEILGANWNLNYKINLGFKTLKIMNTPEE